MTTHGHLKDRFWTKVVPFSGFLTDDVVIECHVNEISAIKKMVQKILFVL